MKHSLSLLITALLVFAFSGCSGDVKLSNEKAQQAVARWLNGNGTAAVTGVLEAPQENSAKADVTLSNFVWNSPKNDAVTAYVFGPGGASHTYSGRADAIFVHYNDGRWVLTKIVTPNGSWDNLNIVASGEGATPPTATTAPIAPTARTATLATTQSKRSLFHKLTDLLGITKVPPERFGVYAFDKGSYIGLSNDRVGLERGDLSSSVQIFAHEDPNQTPSAQGRLPSSSIRRLAFLRFAIQDENNPEGLWVVPAEEENYPIPRFSNFTTKTSETISVATSQVDDDMQMTLLTPQQSLSPGVYAVELQSGGSYLFAVGLGDVPVVRNLHNDCVDIVKQGGTLQPCAVWDAQFKTKFERALSAHDQTTIQKLALPFILATAFSDGAITRALVDQGADVNTVAQVVNSLLGAAANSCNETLATYLLKHGATFDVNALSGTLVMNAASACGLTKLVGMLLEKGADPNINKLGSAPLLSALTNDPRVTQYHKRQGNSDMVAFLLDHGASAKGPGGVQICAGGHMAVLFGVITPLHLAVSCGYIDSAAILVNHGADIEAKGDQGYTPMHAAAVGGNLDGIRWLLDHHANINPRDNKGETPLMKAQFYKHSDAIKLLIANGAQ